MNVPSDFNVWAHVVDLLGSEEDLKDTPVRSPGDAAAEPAKDIAFVRTRSIQLLEVPSFTTAILSWSDPTSCHYTHQCWCINRAVTTGVCAWSGLPIAKGDQVYKPRVAGPKPRNANAMILRRVLDGESIGATR